MTMTWQPPSRVLSLDCEANGLHGQIFAFAATLFVDGVECGVWQGRCPIVSRIDPWVAQNVLPALAGMPVGVRSYHKMLDWWRTIWAGQREEGTRLLVHVGWPVEARFLWDAHKDHPFTGPFPVSDVVDLLERRGHDGTDVTGFLARWGVPLPPGSPHHPLYDARAAYTAWRLLRGEEPPDWRPQTPPA